MSGDDICLVPRPVRLEYVEGMIKLGLWYAVILIERAQRPTSEKIAFDILSRWVNLYRLTDWWDGRYAGDVGAGYVDKRWNELLNELIPLVLKASGNDTSLLENRGLALLRPHLTTAAAKTFTPVETKFGCWNFKAVGHGIADGPGIVGKLTNIPNLIDYALKLVRMPRPLQHLDLHIANNRVPQSPFDDRAEMISSLLALLSEARQAHPSLRQIWCNSWLNSRTVFASLFPEDWMRNAIVMTPEISGGVRFARRRVNTDNWWGQFMTRTGGFNHALAAKFRSSGGVFPYPALLCHTDIDGVESHLRNLEIATARNHF